MASIADLTGTRAPTVVEALSPVSAIGTAASESFDRLAALEIGRQYPAQVVSQLQDGSYVANVADASVRLNLPAGTAVGDTVSLTVLDNATRPSFLLNSTPAGDKASISDAARQVTDIVNQLSSPTASKVIEGKSPVLPAPSDNAPEIAHSLQDTITHSGVFYESHLKEWAQGDRSLQDLQKEPQLRGANLPTSSAPSQTQAPQTGTILSEHANALNPGLSPDKLNPAELTKAPGPLQSNSDKSHGSQETATSHLSPAETQSNMQLQLHSLEQQRVAWHGELWPGQRMEWEVSDQTPSGKSNTSEVDGAWQSTVRFELPTLGRVSATIDLRGQTVQIHVRAALSETSASLNAHASDLIQALDFAGTHLDKLVVKQDDNA